MGELGELIGEKRVVLRRSNGSYNGNNVQQQIRISDLDVGEKQDIIVQLHTSGRDSKDVEVEFEASVHKGGRTFAIPTDVIEDNDLHPGETVVVRLYECSIAFEDGWGDEFVDSKNVIDRVTANKDGQNTSGVDNRLSSESAVEYIEGLDGEAKMMFRNARTEKEGVGETHTNYQGHGNELYFPNKVRKHIDASPGDTIELIAPEDADTDVGDTLAETPVPEEVQEIHEMVTELYEAYTNAND